MIPKQEQPGW